MTAAAPSLDRGLRIGPTLADATLTYCFQRSTTIRAERFAWQQRLWDERINSCSAFIGAVTSYRFSEIERWKREAEDRDRDGTRAARAAC